MQDYHNRWDQEDCDDEDSQVSHHSDWRAATYKPFKNNDINAMKDAGLASAQLHMLELAHNAESETVQYNATAFLLSQAGHGPMAKIEHTHNLKQMPANQLRALIQSKLAEIQKRNPNFDLKTLIMLPSAVSRETINPSSDEIIADVPRETINPSSDEIIADVPRETEKIGGPESSFVPRDTLFEEDNFFSEEDDFEND